MTVDEYVKSMRCSRRAAARAVAQQPRAGTSSKSIPGGESLSIDANVDEARRLDALVVFVWWEDERAGLTFLPMLGLTDCAAYLLSKGHIRRVAPEHEHEDGETWFAVDKLTEGTDDRVIEAPNMLFRRVVCADPYSLDHSRPDLEQPPHAWPESWVEADSWWLSRGQWFSAVSHHLRALLRPAGGGQGAEGSSGGGGGGVDGENGGVMSIALASYRRTALAHVDAGEERWGRWSEDQWMASHVALPPGVTRCVDVLLRRCVCVCVCVCVCILVSSASCIVYHARDAG